LASVANRMLWCFQCMSPVSLDSAAGLKSMSRGGIVFVRLSLTDVRLLLNSGSDFDWHFAWDFDKLWLYFVSATVSLITLTAIDVVLFWCSLLMVEQLAGRWLFDVMLINIHIDFLLVFCFWLRFWSSSWSWFEFFGTWFLWNCDFNLYQNFDFNCNFDCSLILVLVDWMLID